MKKLSKLAAFILVLCLVLMTCASAFAVSRYCSICKKDTDQTRVKQSLDGTSNYPCPGTCMHHTPGCTVTIHAYRYTWWCTVCHEDLYDDEIYEWFEHTSRFCPDYRGY